MDRYLVLKKEQGIGEIYCRDKTLIFDKGQKVILREGIVKLWSLCNMKNDMIALYETDKNEFFAGVISGGKIKSEKMLFKNRRPSECLLVWSEKRLKLFTSEEKDGETEISQRTITSSGVKERILCKTNRNEENMRLFSSEEAVVCAYKTQKGLGAVNCLTDEVFTLDDDIMDYSVCVKNGIIYFLCVLKNSVVLYTVGNTIKKTDVFKGGAYECTSVIFNGNLYLSARDAKKIYIRSCDINDMSFSSMGSFPVKENVKKMPIISDAVCGEFFDSTEFFEMLKKIVPEKAEEKVVAVKKESEKNVFNEALKRNIAEMSAQNSMLNLRAQNMHERYVSQTNELKEEINRLESENEKLRNEKELLKKAKKLLEDEIYRLNNIQDGCDEHKVIDNDEKN